MLPTSQNPYPIYEQNLRFSHPTYDLTKNLIYNMTVAAGTVALNVIYEGRRLIILARM